MSPKPLTLLLLVTLLAALPSSAAVSIFLLSAGSSAPVLPGTRVSWELSARRSFGSGNEATDISVALPVSAFMSNVSIAGDRWTCSTSSTILCTTSLAAAADSTPLRLSFDTPSSSDGGRFIATATMTSSATNTHPGIAAQIVAEVYRTFAVTTADDFGAGSLRDAIALANERCDRSVYCLMTFESPMTIEPRAPLPAVTACNLTIDGGLARAASQDSERPVEISGVKAGWSNGFEIRSWCGVSLRGLTINSFSENGIVLAASKAPAPLGQATLYVEDCFIGTDTKASQARPNGMRGISIETPATVASIRNNTISGNRYSGIAVWAAASADISACRIGAGRDLRPLGNGGSGVFVNGGEVSVNSTVAYNRDFGVTVGPDAADVVAEIEGLFANGVLDFDWGLDGAVRTDRFGHMPPVPELIDATYDPAHNTTIIRGVLPAHGRRSGSFQYSVRIFELAAGRYIAQWPQTNLFATANGDLPFTMSVSGDLRGRPLVAQSFFYLFPDLPAYDSSEVSVPVVAR